MSSVDKSFISRPKRGSSISFATNSTRNPELKSLIDYAPIEAELTTRKKELEEWKELRVKARAEADN